MMSSFSKNLKDVKHEIKHGSFEAAAKIVSAHIRNEHPVSSSFALLQSHFERYKKELQTLHRALKYKQPTEQKALQLLLPVTKSHAALLRLTKELERELKKLG